MDNNGIDEDWKEANQLIKTNRLKLNQAYYLQI